MDFGCGCFKEGVYLFFIENDVTQLFEYHPKSLMLPLFAWVLLQCEQCKIAIAGKNMINECKYRGCLGGRGCHKGVNDIGGDHLVGKAQWGFTECLMNH